MWGHHTHKISDPGRFARLAEMGADNGMTVRHEGTKYVRGWPQASNRPYHIYCDGKFIAAYGTLASLEAALQTRAAGRDLARRLGL